MVQYDTFFFQRVIDYQHQAHLIQDNIDLFNAEADKEHHRLIDIKGHSVKHVWYKILGKLEQQLSEHETAWLKDFEKCKEETDSAQKYLHKCENDHEVYMKTKQELE